MRRRNLRRLTLAVLVSFLLQLLPVTPLRAQDLPLLPPDPPEPPSELVEPPTLDPVIVPPVVDPHVPSLLLQLDVVPEDWVYVGELITATITIRNDAPDQAEALRLTLPLPSEAAPRDPATLPSRAMPGSGNWAGYRAIRVLPLQPPCA